MENTDIKGKEELRSMTLKLDSAYSRAVINMPEKKFTEFAKSLSSEAQKVLLDQHRDNRNFFKGILQEEYRKEHPNSLRYEDSEIKIKKYNIQGKIIKGIINSSKN